jgi:hypothetical protein
MLTFFSARARLSSLALAALAVSGSLGAPAKADPPIGLPLFCFRFTDVKQIDAVNNDFQFEFEILNWTRQEADKLTVSFPLSGSNTPTGSSLNNGVQVVQAFVDADGRKLPPDPVKPIPGNQTPTNNNWASSLGNSVVSGFNVKQAVYTAGTKIPNIDISGIQVNRTPQEAIIYVNTRVPGPTITPPPDSQVLGDSTGHFPNQDFSPLEDPETVDNGTNVLDGFAFEVNSFDPGDYLVYEWQLDPDSNSPGGRGIGILARSVSYEASFTSPIGGFTSTGPTVSNSLLFAPGSPPVGSEFGFTAVLGAGVPGLASIKDVNPVVPGPLPLLGVALSLGYSRKLRRRLHQASKVSVAR